MLVYPINHLSASAAKVEYMDSYDNESNLVTYTDTQNFGDEHPDRYIIIGICGFQNTDNPSVASATIGGVPATLLATVNSSDGESVFAIMGAYVPTGTSGNVSVTFSRSMDRIAVATWRATGLLQTTPRDVGTDDTLGLSMSCSVAALAGGFIVGICGDEVSGTTEFSWSSLTEDLDSGTSQTYSSYTAAHKHYSAAETVNETVTFSNSGSRSGMILAAFR